MTYRHARLRVLQPETPYLVGSSTQRPIPDDELTIRVRHTPNYVLVAVTGEIDIATVAGLRERLVALAAGGRPLVINLDEVGFIDAAGLGALVGAAGLATEHGASLHVVCDQPHIRRLFRITGLDRSIPLARTLAEALRIMTAGAAAQAPHGAVVRWSPPDPDVLRDALAALRQLA